MAMSLDPGDLYIKSDVGDNGTTHPLQDGTNFWESPSLWLSDMDVDAPPPSDADKATVGLLRYINVRVDNKGNNDHIDVQVQVWIANPTLGLQPFQAIPDGPDAFKKRPDFSNPTPPAVPEALTVPKNSSATLRVPWKPTSDDLTDQNFGSPHLCIAANCFALTEGVIFTPGGSPFDAKTFQHMAQRNITLLPAGQRGGQIRFPFEVANVRGIDAEFTLAVDEILGDDGLDVLGREQVLLGRFTTISGVDVIEMTRLRAQYFCQQLGQPIERALLAAGGAPVLVDSRDSFEVHGADTRAQEAVFSSANILDDRRHEHGHVRCEEPTVRARAGTLVPVTLDVTIAEQTGAGGVHTFQVRQYDDTGTVVGGIRFMALAVTEELLNPCTQRYAHA
jgi:hypothetical protein